MISLFWFFLNQIHCDPWLRGGRCLFVVSVAEQKKSTLLLQELVLLNFWVVNHSIACLRCATSPPSTRHLLRPKPSTLPIQKNERARLGAPNRLAPEACSAGASHGPAKSAPAGAGGRKDPHDWYTRHVTFRLRTDQKYTRQ